MPKVRLETIKFTEKDASIPCQMCGFYTKSPTAMRLHRKSRHGITTPYKEEGCSLLICCGCGKVKSKCVCRK